MKILKILALFILMTQSGFGDVQVPEDYKVSLMLPVNWKEDNSQINLIVTIPEGFKPLQALDEDSNMYEFIPKGESADNWSEIITVNKFVGQKVSAIALIQYLKKTMLEQVQNGTVWSESVEEDSNYQTGILGLNYDLNGQHEVIQAQYYSGPYDCVGVQYTIRSKDDDAASQKIEDFFKNNVRIDIAE